MTKCKAPSQNTDWNRLFEDYDKEVDDWFDKHTEPIYDSPKVNTDHLTKYVIKDTPRSAIIPDVTLDSKVSKIKLTEAETRIQEYLINRPDAKRAEILRDLSIANNTYQAYRKKIK